jgi:hypothetical protein
LKEKVNSLTNQMDEKISSIWDHLV